MVKEDKKTEAKKTETPESKNDKDEALTKEEQAEVDAAMIPSVEELEAAKKRADEARAKLQAAKKKVTEAKRIQTSYEKRKARLEEQIAKAKAGTNKSRDDLLTKAKELEAEAKKVLEENKDILEGTDEKREELATLEQTLNEARAKSGRKVGGNVNAAKAAFVKALGRRQFNTRFDNEGAAEYSRRKETGKPEVMIEFGAETWTIKCGDHAEVYAYGAGAIQVAEDFYGDAVSNKLEGRKPDESLKVEEKVA